MPLVRVLIQLVNYVLCGIGRIFLCICGVTLLVQMSGVLCF